jgi:hypothetical protein
VGTAFLAIMGAIAVSGDAAIAAGDPTLGHVIAIIPPPGWQLEPGASSTNNLSVSEFKQQLKDAPGVAEADESWYLPDSSEPDDSFLWDELIVHVYGMNSRFQSNWSGSERHELNADCGSGATVRSVSGIPNSEESSCSRRLIGASSRGPFTVIMWNQGDTDVEMFATGIPTTEVESLAHQEAAAIPAGGFAGSGASSGNEFLFIGVGAVVVVLFAVIFVKRGRRRTAIAVLGGESYCLPETASPPIHVVPSAESATSFPPFAMGQSLPPLDLGETPTTTVAPGWHPIQGDRTRIAYWDGNSWSAYRQWNGEQWVELIASPGS